MILRIVLGILAVAPLLTAKALNRPSVDPLDHILTAVSERLVKKNWDTISSMVSGDLKTPGFRATILTYKLKRYERSLLLTAKFASPSHATSPLPDEVSDQISAFASVIASRFLDENNRSSRYLSVVGTFPENTCDISTKEVCLTARIFDTTDTNPETFRRALRGHVPSDTLAQEIRRLNPAWPVGSTFISRSYNSCRCSRQHFGLDLTAATGTPVQAMLDGTVRNVGGMSGWGRTVVLEHETPLGQKFITLYAHLSRFRPKLKVGDKVTRGETIARSGATGTSDGPHLHIEIRRLVDDREPLTQPLKPDDYPLDPLEVLDLSRIFIGTSLP